MTPAEMAKLQTELNRFKRNLHRMARVCQGMGNESRKRGEGKTLQRRQWLVGMGNVLGYALKFLQRNMQECDWISEKLGWPFDVHARPYKPVHSRVVAYSEPICNGCRQKTPVEVRYQNKDIFRVKKRLAYDFNALLRAGECYGNYAIDQVRQLPDEKPSRRVLAVFYNSRARLRWGYGCTIQNLADFYMNDKGIEDRIDAEFDLMRFDARQARQMGFEVELCQQCEGRLIDVRD